MAGNRTGRGSHGGAIAALALAAALLWGAPAAAADPHTTPQDRQRFVAVARNLERAPLDPALKADREWALAWLIEAPDVSVTACADTLPGLLQAKYRYGPDIVVQEMLAMGVYAIEHPEAAANDQAAQQLAGTESALNAYRSILRDQPKARLAALDALLETQACGGLPELVRAGWARCATKK
jgi:hypothetical protein